MTTLREASASELRDALEDLYRCSDALLASLTEAEWGRKHGKDWTMADVPYHLAYFDRELVVTKLEVGPDLPAAAQQLLSTTREVNDWNARMFALRPPGQTGPQSLEELRGVRDRARSLTAALSDTDLDRRAFAALAGVGWRDTRYILTGAIMHNWSEHVQLLIRLGRKGPLPAANTTHLALDGFMRHFPMGITNRVAAPFKARFVITGPGGGAWLMSAHEFACEVVEDASTPADVTMTMTPETWCRMWNEMNNPMLLMLTRRIKVKGLTRLGAFGKVFAPPKPDVPFSANLVQL